MKKRFKISNNLILSILLIALITFFSLTNRDFVSFNNISSMLKNTAIIAILALGLTPLMIARGIDISFGSSVSFLTVVMALLISSGINLWLILLLGIIIATTIGLINGFLIEKFNLNALIFTLGIWSILQAFAFVLSDIKSISIFSEQVYSISNTTILNIPIAIFIFIILYFVYWLILTFTKFGKDVYAIGGNPIVANLFGLRVKKIKIILYSVMGFFTGLASIISLITSGVGSSFHGSNLVFPSLSAVLLGGIAITGGGGSIWGTFLGMLVISVLLNGLKNMNIHYYLIQIIQGIVFIVIVSSYEIRNRRKAGT